MPWEPREILKVYNYVNDEKRPKVNIKFLGIFLALVVAAGALFAYAAISWPSGGTSPKSGDGVASGTKREYVGLTQAEIESGAPSSVAAARYAAWQAEHSDADVESVEPVYAEDGRLVGYWIEYREPPPSQAAVSGTPDTGGVPDVTTGLT